MPVSIKQSIIIIVVCAICTVIERLLPFLMFRKGHVPEIINYLGKVLPAAIIGSLVVYCLRKTNFIVFSGFIPQVVATATTILLHLWKKNTLLSVFGGTAVYMFFVRFMSI